jgi:hypothetical protein
LIQDKLDRPPRVVVDRARIARFRARGLSWAKIAAQLGVGERLGTKLHREAVNRKKTFFKDPRRPNTYRLLE